MAQNTSLFTAPPKFKKLRTEQDPGLRIKESGAFEKGLRSASLAVGGGILSRGISGIADFEARIAEAKEIRFSAGQERIKGTLEAATTLEELNDIQASNIVLAFAQGRRLSGSVASIQSAASSKANFSISLTRLNTEINSLALEREANHKEAVAKWEKEMAPLRIASGLVLAYYGVVT